MSKAITKTKLTGKQELFCLEYIKDFNGTRAAIAAGYSKKTAKAIANENLSKPYLQQYIANIAGKIFKKKEIQVEEVLEKLVLMAHFDVAQMYDKNGDLKNIHDIPEEIRRIIQGVKINQTNYGKDDSEVSITTKDIKIPDRLKATELLGRYMKMFVDQVEHTGDIKIVVMPASQDDGGNGKLIKGK